MRFEKTSNIEMIMLDIHNNLLNEYWDNAEFILSEFVKILHIVGAFRAKEATTSMIECLKIR